MFWRKTWNRFDETHPRLTDEEYLALFDWDVDPEIALKVRQIFADFANFDAAQLRPDDRLAEDLKLD